MPFAIHVPPFLHLNAAQGLTDIGMQPLGLTPVPENPGLHWQMGLELGY
jgi:hypothetical protein